MANTFFYPQAFRAYLAQFMRAISGFQIKYNGTTLQTVPVQMGAGSRQVASIIANNSENFLTSVPMMSAYISGLEYARDMIQNPTYVGTTNVQMRNIDPTTGTFGSSRGNAFTVDRYMPVPYKMTVKVDIYTSNLDQKCQLLEQILPLFNPSFDIQSDSNYINWASLTYITLTETTWSSKSIPVVADGAIDVATLTFVMPIWLSLPAVVRKLGVIERIYTNVYSTSGDLTTELINKPAGDLVASVILTPLDFSIFYSGNTLKLIQYITEQDQSVVYSWCELLNAYGKSVINGISQIQLDLPNGNIVLGTVSLNPLDASTLIYLPISTTLPNDTLTPINAIIDPYQVPQSMFSSMVAGASYLILNPIGALLNNSNSTYSQQYGMLIAGANDIIQWDGTQWNVLFSAKSATTVQFVTNLTTNIQYQFNLTTFDWSKTLEGIYSPGNWTISLSN